MDEARDCLVCGQVSHSRVGESTDFGTQRVQILVLSLITKKIWASYWISGNFYPLVKWRWGQLKPRLYWLKEKAVAFFRYSKVIKYPFLLFTPPFWLFEVGMQFLFMKSYLKNYRHFYICYRDWLIPYSAPYWPLSTLLILSEPHFSYLKNQNDTNS